MTSSASTMIDGRQRFHATDAYLGYRAADTALPYTRFLRAEGATSPAALAASIAGPVAADAVTQFADCATALSRPGTLPCETGWTILADGVAMVAVHTPMPGVRAHMWDWWFAWHGSEAARYKLWCPAAHLVAQWADGDGERPGPRSYIGRTSLIKEYIGSVFLVGAIRFVPPETLGFRADACDGTVICGRAGEVDAPVEHTWLIHQVRNTADGCEMRSRFYLGQDPQLTTTGQRLPPPAADAPRPGPIPAELLLHCAAEMRHLAGILPSLYGAFAKEAKAKKAVLF